MKLKMAENVKQLTMEKVNLLVLFLAEIFLKKDVLSVLGRVFASSV